MITLWLQRRSTGRPIAPPYILDQLWIGVPGGLRYSVPVVVQAIESAHADDIEGVLDWHGVPVPTGIALPSITADDLVTMMPIDVTFEAVRR